MLNVDHRNEVVIAQEFNWIKQQKKNLLTNLLELQNNFLSYFLCLVLLLHRRARCTTARRVKLHNFKLLESLEILCCTILQHFPIMLSAD